MVEKKKLELNALLEVTQAINSNMAEGALYKIFYFTCISNLRFQKLALVVKEEGDFVCKVAHGIDIGPEVLESVEGLNFRKKIIAREDLETLRGFDPVHFALPVAHKEKNLAVVLIGELGRDEQHDLDEFSFVRTLANVIMVAIENKRLGREALKREALRKEMEIAQNVQSLLFPRQLPDNEMVSLFSSYLPHTSVGGDYYDYIEMGDHEHLVCIADVSGKGVPAAILMSNFQAALRTLARTTHDLEEIILELNHLLIANAQGNHFITFFCGIYNEQNRVMRFVNAGHNPPLIVNNSALTFLKEGTVMLGAFENLPFLKIGEVKMLPSTLLFCYTDGITETSNDAGEEFGEERLQQFLLDNSSEGLATLHHTLIVDLDGFKEHQSYNDDLTLLSCRFH